MAKRGKFQTALEYATVRAVLAVLGILPISWSLAAGKAMSRVAYLLAAELRRTGTINLALAFPEKSDSERRILLKGCFDNLGRGLGLFAHFCSSDRKTIFSVVDTTDLDIRPYHEAQQAGKGVILFTGHLGAWELTSFGFSALEHPFAFLVRRLDNEMIEQVVDATRTRFGNETIDKFSAGRLMFKTLRSGKTLGLLIDLNTLDEEAIFVDFFGVPASTTFMVSKLALRTGSPILPLFAPWDNATGKFKLILSPPVAVETTGDEEEDVRRLTENLSMIVENYVRQYPEQWLWIHKRWKTRPPGAPEIY
jgi:KDO2-lipid IV(A) lauroyltransferase